jgi:long-chain acyl-CoA synthetase
MTEPSTLAQLPAYVLERHPKADLLQRTHGGVLENVSAATLVEQVLELSLGLIECGVAAGDRVAIISESRVEWTIADLAIITAGAIVVPIYPTLASGQMRYILADSGARVAIASNGVQATKILEHVAGLPSLETIMVIDPDGVPSSTAIRLSSEVSNRGRATLAADPGGARSRHRARIDAVAPGDLATIIYTSGTTGEPKGVMLTHANLLANIRDTLGALPPVTESDVALTFLPLSHGFERLVVYLYLYCGVTIAFAESIETLSRDLALVRPTLVTGVPRVYEKLHARILEKVRASSRVRQAIFHWAVRVGTRRLRSRLAGGRPNPLVAAQYALADRLVFRPIRDRVGGRLRFFVSGSAPLSAPIAEFFYAAGLPVVEGYGLTETSPVVAVTPPEAPRFGSVGKPIPNVDLRIADDGEILVRGPNVMPGYFRKPDQTASAVVEGWFHTGDIGEVDDRGYLKITDRKKELIVTAGGKKIAPQPIENQLRTDPLIAEAIVIGDRRKFPIALIVPDFSALQAEARRNSIATADRDALLADPRIHDLYERAIERVNRELGQFERLKKFALLPRELTIDAGELTPTLKVRRKVVEEKWKDVIEDLYGPQG